MAKSLVSCFLTHGVVMVATVTVTFPTRINISYLPGDTKENYHFGPRESEPTRFSHFYKLTVVRKTIRVLGMPGDRSK